jgi:hypothetical protein
VIGDFKVTCSKMVLVCFLGNEGVFLSFKVERGGMAWFLSFTYHDLFSRAYLFFRHFHGVVQ